MDGLSMVVAGVFTVDAHAIPAHRAEPPHTHFNVVYAFRAARSELTPTDEVLEARWQPLDAVAELTTDRAILRAIRRLAAFV